MFRLIFILPMLLSMGWSNLAFSAETLAEDQAAYQALLIQKPFPSKPVPLTVLELNKKIAANQTAMAEKLLFKNLGNIEELGQATVVTKMTNSDKSVLVKVASTNSHNIFSASAETPFDKGTADLYNNQKPNLGVKYRASLTHYAYDPSGMVASLQKVKQECHTTAIAKKRLELEKEIHICMAEEKLFVPWPSTDLCTPKNPNNCQTIKEHQKSFIAAVAKKCKKDEILKKLENYCSDDSKAINDLYTKELKGKSFWAYRISADEAKNKFSYNEIANDAFSDINAQKRDLGVEIGVARINGFQSKTEFSIRKGKKFKSQKTKQYCQNYADLSATTVCSNKTIGEPIQTDESIASLSHKAYFNKDIYAFEIIIAHDAETATSTLSIPVYFTMAKTEEKKPKLQTGVRGDCTTRTENPDDSPCSLTAFISTPFSLNQ